MYRLTINTDRVLVFITFSAGLAAVLFFPPQFPEKVIEIPFLALLVGEVGLALFASLLFYENANSKQIVKLGASMLSFAMLTGAAGNCSGQLTQMLPDSFVLVSWIQLIIMNIAGILSTLALYRLTMPETPYATHANLAEAVSVQPATKGQQAADTMKLPAIKEPVLDATPETAAANHPKHNPSVKEILESLDISRIMHLERSIHPPEATSLENLFKEESSAAQSLKESTQASIFMMPGNTDASTVGSAQSKNIGATNSPGLSKTLTLKGPTREEPVSAKMINQSDDKIDHTPASSTQDVVAKALPAYNSEQSHLVQSSQTPSSQPFPESTAPAQKLTTDTIRLIREPIELSAVTTQPVQEQALSGTDTLALPPVHTAPPPSAALTPQQALTPATLQSTAEAPASAEGTFTEQTPQGELEQGAEQTDLPNLQELLKTEHLTGPLPSLEEEISAEANSSDSYNDEQVEAQLDEAFKKLVPKEALRNVSAETLAQLKDAQHSLRENFIHDLDETDLSYADTSTLSDNNSVGSLIRTLAEKEQQHTSEQQQAQDEAPTLPPTAPTEVKEFGRLSARTRVKPPESVDTAGSMKTIGKMLIDPKAIENIIKHGEKRSGGVTTTKIISAKRGEEIRSLLSYIDHYPGVTGSLIVGNDGLVIDSTLDSSQDQDLLSALSLAIASNSNLTSEKLFLGTVREIILRASDKVTVLRKLEEGILVVLCDSAHAGRLDGLHKLLSSLIKEQPLSTDSTQVVAPPGYKEPVKNALTANNAQSTAPFDPPLQHEPVAADQVRDLIASFSNTAPASCDENITTPGERELPSQQADVAADLVVHSSALNDPVIQAEEQRQSISELIAYTGSTTTREVESIPEVQESLDATPLDIPSRAVEEFGRLSSASGSYPRLEQESSGTMSIGKMLLDVQAVANIIKSADKQGLGLTTAKVISAARGEGIKMLLAQIDNYPGVAGSLIVGLDGLVIASTLGPELDKDVLGPMSSSVHSHSDIVTNKLDLGSLHQIVLQSKDTITILTNVEVGVLGVFCVCRELEKLNGLLEAINTTVHT